MRIGSADDVGKVEDEGNGSQTWHQVDEFTGIKDREMLEPALTVHCDEDGGWRWLLLLLVGHQVKSTTPPD